MAGLKALFAEFTGTFALVFAGTGAIISNEISDGAVTHVGIALTFGLVVLAMILTFGEVSGAHLNPAVTVGLVVAGRFPSRRVMGYLLAQCGAALAASLLWRLLVPDHDGLGRTVPAGPASQSLILEGVLTFLLMMAILESSRQGSSTIDTGIAVGAVIALEALFAGPISGASMNPARSLAPAAVTGQLDFLWIYLTGPLLGACLASILHGRLWPAKNALTEPFGCEIDAPSV